jgi:hypothetical protein
MSSSNAAYIPYRGGWREVALPPFPFPFPVQASTSPVLDLAWAGLAWKLPKQEKKKEELLGKQVEASLWAKFYLLSQFCSFWL